MERQVKWTRHSILEREGEGGRKGGDTAVTVWDGSG